MDQSGRIDQISAVMGRMRVLIGRRVISRLAMAELGPILDLSDLDVLEMVPGPGSEREVSVGDIARQMRIDPSRASRLVAGLVERGYLLRAVAQQDARRAVLLRSEQAERVLTEIHRVKRQLIADIVSDWPAEEIGQFADGFETFIAALERRTSP